MRGMRTVTAGTMGLVLGACGGGPRTPASTTPTPDAGRTANDVEAARATKRNAAGDSGGVAQLTSNDDGAVHLVVNVRGMPAGQHGIHFHAVAACDGAAQPPFGSAGGHHNPLSRQHGLDNADGPHAGDLPNLTVAADGTGSLDAVTPRATLRSGPASLFDADGSALVIHAGADDQKTDPAGNSGARVACGVIEQGG
jgi:Cu-Zn family superoxide dismutase